MPVPDFQSLMLPLLQSAADGAEWSMADIRETLRASLGLGDADLAERLPSGRQTVFSNRVGWAKTFLDRALLLESPRRAHVRITERGKALLAENPDRVDMKLLMRFPEYARWREESLAGAKSARGDSDAADDDAIAETETTGTPE